MFATSPFEVDLPLGDWQLTIFDLQGKSIHRLDINQQASVLTNDWAKGIYLLEVVNKVTTEKSISKLVIQ